MLHIDEPPRAGEASLRWVWQSKSFRAAAACLMVYVVLAIVSAPLAFVNFIQHYTGALSFFIPILIWPCCALGLFVLFKRRDWPALRSHMTGRLALAALLSVALLLAFSAYTTFKFQIEEHVPFYADTWAADLDALLHGGDAWRLAHKIWPDDWSKYIFYCYNYVWFLYWFGTPLFVVFWAPRELVKRYLWSMLLTFIVCGTILATLYSSVGPIFYPQMLQDPRYDELIARLSVLGEMDHVLAYSNYLFESQISGEAVFGTGISAIPSMHVAVVTLNACFFSTLNRWAGTLAWLFWAIIMFGSVYTGWHYAIDGYMSLLAVTAIWAGVRRAHRMKAVPGFRFRVPRIKTAQA